MLPSLEVFLELLGKVNAAWLLGSDLWFAKCFHTVPKYLLPTCLKYRQGKYYYPPFCRWESAQRDKMICSRISRCHLYSNPTSVSKFSTFSFRLFYIFYIGMSHKGIFVADVSNTVEVLIYDLKVPLLLWLLLCVQSCPTLCDPTDCGLPGSSVHGSFQARILETVAISSSRGSSQPRDQTRISCVAGRFFTAE